MGCSRQGRELGRLGVEVALDPCGPTSQPPAAPPLPARHEGAKVARHGSLGQERVFRKGRSSLGHEGIGLQIWQKSLLEVGVSGVGESSAKGNKRYPAWKYRHKGCAIGWSV